MIETLNIPETRKQYYRRLLHENPRRNLVERYALFGEHYPDFCRKRLSYIPEMMKDGWVAMSLSDEGMNYAFTIGLEYSFGHPEILIASPNRPVKMLHRMVELLAARASGGERFAPELDYGEMLRTQPDFSEVEGTTVFREYGENDLDNYPCGYLYSFYGYFADRDLTDNKLPMLILELDFPMRPAPPGGRLSSIMSTPKLGVSPQL
ncbi:DUF4262 domain-containing protein [Saccharibacillus sp. CPCC 101409]|uniref:DUF4262 domain-containing protein n=1 Tax=Saccharibacillus sp. CPCC 101409 TaxID=3058041 RepID=UPI0026715CD0|nr:DUF4262 domain-containing protein [Saccharibacillus sp. CPCC 101409]MDO3413104.1 DUF4262 domain-containing protein [Saccharibacillus sp. CPCC 101409]